MIRRNTLAMIGSVAVLLLIASVSIVGGVSSLYFNQQTAASQNPRQLSTSPAIVTYNNNRLSCALPADTPDTPSFIQYLVPLVTTSSGFLSVANGNPYVYEYFDNIGDGVNIVGGTWEGGAIVGGTTEHLPPAVEMMFYTYGASTVCGETNPNAAIYAIDVQVPIQNGLFNITGASIHLTHTGD